MNSTWSRFNITSIVLGFAFLYLPIVLLVIFSFNESKLVTVWAGFSTKWYVSLFSNQGLMNAAWVTIRVGLLSASVATVLGTLAALALTSILLAGCHTMAGAGEDIQSAGHAITNAAQK